MKTVFADTFFWIATLHPGDQWRRVVESAAASLEGVLVVTTEGLLVEVLSFVSGMGSAARTGAADLVRRLGRDPLVEVIHQSHESFLRGLDLYERRADKGYSLVDCISMVVMRERGITEVLSGDQHFRQEGFVPLIDPDAS